MEQYWRTIYGNPQTSRAPAGKLRIAAASYAGKKRIVGFDLRAYFRQENDRGQATGHLDLWDGAQWRHEDYLSVATTIHFRPVAL
jgi:hypothetical protein